MMKTVERLALFVQAEKQRSVLCELIVDGEGAAECGSPLWYPLVCGGKLWTLELFISLCGLICLRGGMVPRCGLAPILPQCECWICWRGLNEIKLKRSYPECTQTQCTSVRSSVRRCIRWLTRSVSLIPSNYRGRTQRDRYCR